MSKARNLALLLALYVMAAFSAFATSTIRITPATALEIVLQTHADEIAAFDDASNSALDTKDRSWSVQRPPEADGADTTWIFIVTYRIDGKIVAKWQVDTRTSKTIALPPI